MQRRSLIAGLGSLLIAPAIVRASSLMPISTNLMRFSKADMLMVPFGLVSAHYNSITNVWRRDEIVGARISPLNADETILLFASGRVEHSSTVAYHDLVALARRARHGRLKIGPSDRLYA